MFEHKTSSSMVKDQTWKKMAGKATKRMVEFFVFFLRGKWSIWSFLKFFNARGVESGAKICVGGFVNYARCRESG